MPSYIFKTYIGQDTEVCVDFEFNPHYPPAHEPFEDDEPTIDERVDINRVWINHDTSKIDDLLPFLRQSVIDLLAQEALKFAEQEAQA